MRCKPCAAPIIADSVDGELSSAGIHGPALPTEFPPRRHCALRRQAEHPARRQMRRRKPKCTLAAVLVCFFLPACIQANQMTDPVAQVSDDPGLRLLPPCPSPPRPSAASGDRRHGAFLADSDCAQPGFRGFFDGRLRPFNVGLSAACGARRCGSWACRAAVKTGHEISEMAVSEMCCASLPWLLAAPNPAFQQDS